MIFGLLYLLLLLLILAGGAGTAAVLLWLVYVGDGGRLDLFRWLRAMSR